MKHDYLVQLNYSTFNHNSSYSFLFGAVSVYDFTIELLYILSAHL